MLKFISILEVKILLYSLELPEVGKYPNTHYWYLFINSFSNDLMKKWIEKAPKKVAPKPADDDDLFGEEETAPKEKPKAAQPVVKKPKEKPVAKSILVFDVKICDT